jgi:hypothetical protein
LGHAHLAGMQIVGSIALQGFYLLRNARVQDNRQDEATRTGLLVAPARWIRAPGCARPMQFDELMREIHKPSPSSTNLASAT